MTVPPLSLPPLAVRGRGYWRAVCRVRHGGGVVPTILELAGVLHRSVPAGVVSTVFTRASWGMGKGASRWGKRVGLLCFVGNVTCSLLFVYPMMCMFWRVFCRELGEIWWRT